jgi:hypothetical protein
MAMSGQMPDPPATRSSGPPAPGIPDEIPADRPAELQLVAGAQLAGEILGYLAIVKTFDGEGETLVGRGRRRYRVAALRLVAVVSGQAHVHVLTGLMARPSRHGKHQAAHTWSLIDEVHDLGGAPDQSPL